MTPSEQSDPGEIEAIFLSREWGMLVVFEVEVVSKTIKLSLKLQEGYLLYAEHSCGSSFLHGGK